MTQSGAVDTNTVGTYTLTYTATDAAGNTTTQTQIVEVQPSHYATGGTSSNSNSSSSNSSSSSSSSSSSGSNNIPPVTLSPIPTENENAQDTTEEDTTETDTEVMQESEEETNEAS